MHVIFITKKLQHYRVPIFTHIVNKYNIKILVIEYEKNSEYKKIENGIEVVGIRTSNLSSFIKNYAKINSVLCTGDVILMMNYLQSLLMWRILFTRMRKKLILWGIGVRASQSSRYDSFAFTNIFRYFSHLLAAKLLFYSEYPLKKYRKLYRNDKLYVANNTVHSDIKLVEYAPKDIILFVGTLNKSKRIVDVLNIYTEANLSRIALPELHICGDGPEADIVKEYAFKSSETNTSARVVYHGAIYDDIVLSKLYSRAIISISPGQAGLSVLKSFAHGVPFVTYKDAITGGEIFNINHGNNGLLLNSYSQMKDVIFRIKEDILLYENMGKAARLWYVEMRSSERMADEIYKPIHDLYHGISI